MDTPEISATVFIHGETVLLMTEPDKMPEDYAPFRAVGRFTYRGGQIEVTPVAEDRDANMLILGEGIRHFMAHVERVRQDEARTAGSVAWLERLHSL